MTNKNKAVEVLYEELDRMIERVISNFDLSYAEVIGVLAIKSAQLAQQVIKENET